MSNPTTKKPTNTDAATDALRSAFDRADHVRIVTHSVRSNTGEHKRSIDELYGLHADLVELVLAINAELDTRSKEALSEPQVTALQNLIQEKMAVAERNVRDVKNGLSDPLIIEGFQQEFGRINALLTDRFRRASERMNTVEGRVDTLEGDVAGIKDDVRDLKNDHEVLFTSTSNMNSRLRVVEKLQSFPTGKVLISLLVAAIVAVIWWANGFTNIRLAPDGTVLSEPWTPWSSLIIGAAAFGILLSILLLIPGRSGKEDTNTVTREHTTTKAQTTREVPPAPDHVRASVQDAPAYGTSATGPNGTTIMPAQNSGAASVAR
jgi:hypothetical protein